MFLAQTRPSLLALFATLAVVPESTLAAAQPATEVFTRKEPNTPPAVVLHG
jgi:hypothetical protein